MLNVKCAPLIKEPNPMEKPVLNQLAKAVKLSTLMALVNNAHHIMQRARIKNNVLKEAVLLFKY